MWQLVTVFNIHFIDKYTNNLIEDKSRIYASCSDFCMHITFHRTDDWIYTCMYLFLCVNSRRTDEYIHQGSIPALVQIMACHLFGQAIISTNTGLLFIEPLGTNCGKFWIGVQQHLYYIYSFIIYIKIILEALSAKSRSFTFMPQCFGS